MSHTGPPRYRVRRINFGKDTNGWVVGWRIDILVSHKGYYITLPRLFETKDAAIKAAEEEMKK